MWIKSHVKINKYWGIIMQKSCVKKQTTKKTKQKKERNRETSKSKNTRSTC